MPGAAGFIDLNQANQRPNQNGSHFPSKWLGREVYFASDWPAVREEAARARNQRTAEYLLGMPLVGDFLEEGLSMPGYSCCDTYLAPGQATPGFGYGYFLWWFPGSRRQFALLGDPGQRICVDPVSKLVLSPNERLSRRSFAT